MREIVEARAYNEHKLCLESNGMASESCQFVKPNSERCKRSVAAGEKFCWQHSRGVRARWRSLTRNQAVIFCIGVAGLAATLWFGMRNSLPGNWKGRESHVQPSRDQPANVVVNQGKGEIENQKRGPRRQGNGEPGAGLKLNGASQGASAVLLLNCEMQALPIRYGPGNPVWVLDTQLLNGLMQYFVTEKGSDSFWPSADYLGEFAYRCELVNYSEDPVFGIAMDFTVALLETKKDESGNWRGDGSRITGGHIHHVEIAKVDSRGGKFVFYTWNGTIQFVTVTPPQYAEAELAKAPNRVQIHLKQPSSQGPIPMLLSPRKELLK